VNRDVDSASQDGLAWFRLAVYLREQRDTERAIEAYRRAIGRDPGLSAAHEQLGKLLYRECRAEEAAEVYRAWHRLDPSNPVAAHMAAATGTMPPPVRAADGFVQALFDRAADDYDAGLAQLDYQVPRILHECAIEVLGAREGSFDVLDLGCGTGLCGELFRPLARRIAGVDLSPAMLCKAHQREVYDELHCEEISAYLAACSERFDLLLAADVFCYFGDLRNVLASGARVLRPGGWFMFSVESLGERNVPRGFELQEHGRYSHTAAHVERSLSGAILNPIRVQTVSLRFERGALVDGLAVVARATPVGDP
jgi:predicted TPR repeat methyltransferase